MSLLKTFMPTKDQLVAAFKNKNLTAMEATTPPLPVYRDKSGVVKHSFLDASSNHGLL